MMSCFGSDSCNRVMSDFGRDSCTRVMSRFGGDSCNFVTQDHGLRTWQQERGNSEGWRLAAA
jgi:hypothetical protein